MTPPPELTATVRIAVPDDAPGIQNVIATYQFKIDGSGQLIPVALPAILNLIGQGAFYVAAVGEEVVGCAALKAYGGLAEMRSWALLPGYRGKNLGVALAKKIIEEATTRGHDTLYTLTQPQNFERVQRLGFMETKRPAEKLLKDCAVCPIYDHCNETAFVMSLRP